MDATLRKKVEELFHRAVAIPIKERSEFLLQFRNEDPQVLELLDQLLKEDRLLSRDWEAGLASSVRKNLAEQFMQLPAESLGPYDFVRPLGQGGMGTVYQAKHRDTGQIVAIKVLRSGELSVASRERFSLEQRLLAKLDHPLIASLYGSESFRDGTPCFIMEYVQGEPLSEWCRKHNCLVRQRVELFRQVCEAVQHAHQHGIIHRDLKPSNILVKPDGNVRLLDFGIAKQLDPEGVNLTEDKPAPLTLAYAAPEQIDGGSVGTHTDVYALGLTLYELLTGQPAQDLTGLGPAGWEAVIRERVPSAPSRLMKPFGGGWDTKDLDLICLTAIHKDPERRYQMVEALIRDLDHWLRREPIEARPDSFLYTAGRFVQRKRRELAAAAIVAILFMAGAAWFAINLANARDTAVYEQTKTQRIEAFVLLLFDNGDPSAGPSRSATALTMLDRGREVAKTMSNQPEFQTDLQEVLGSLYGKVGRLDDANALLQSASARRMHDKSATVKQKSESLIALGLLRADQSRFPEAEKLARQGLTLLKADKRTDLQDVASAESALGTVLMESRQFRTAIPLLEEALRIQSRPGGSENELAKTVGALASSQQEAGNFSMAENLNRRALTIDRRLYGDANPLVARDLMSIGNVLQEERRFPDAVMQYRKAIPNLESWYGKEHPKTIEALLTLGQALLMEGQYQEASNVLTEGLQLGKKVLGRKNELILFAMNALGTLEQKMGDLPLAEIYFKQMLAGSRELRGDESLDVAFARANLAVLEQAEGKYSDAELQGRESIKTLEAALPSNHPNLAIAWMNLGRCLLREGKYDEAEKLLQKAELSLRQQLGASADLKKTRDALEELKRLRGH